MTLPIVVWKWQPPNPRPNLDFTHEHVNRVAGMLGRNMRMDHELVCITDDPSGIDGSVRILPMPEIPQDGMQYRCWRKLMMFDPEFTAEIGDRFATMDLDVVITDDVTPIFERPEPFVIWHGPTPDRAPYNGSLVMMDRGARREVWDQFSLARAQGDLLKRQANGKELIGSDQAWIALCLGPLEATWAKKHGVLSYRFDCVPALYRNNPARTPFVTEEPPPNTRMVFFHGKWDPSMRPIQDRFPWIARHWF